MTIGRKAKESVLPWNISIPGYKGALADILTLLGLKAAS
jgi:hypothetical protein